MASKSNQKLAVIIPMYNEEKGAAKCISAVTTVIESMPHVSLLIVDDGSADKTPTILAAAKNKKLIVITHERNQGYGAALATGIKEAIKHGFDFGLFMDSDLTNDPAMIPVFAAEMNSGFDCVKASRYITGGGMDGVPVKRQLISRIGNFIASSLFGMGIRDCTNGFRMVRLSLLKHVTFVEKKFAIILEELYYLKQGRARCKEIPIILTSRIGTKSSFAYTPQTFWTYLKYALKAALV